MDQLISFWIIVASILSFPVTAAFFAVIEEIKKPDLAEQEDIIA